MSTELSADHAEIDRRAFLGTVASAAGVLLAASLAPLSQGRAAGRQTLPRVDGSPGATEGDRAEPSQDWDVDDMWGHRPRYAHPIPYGPARTSPVLWEHVDPIDYMLVI